MTTYYEKIGRKYVPVAQYNAGWDNMTPYGTHITLSKPNGFIRNYHIDPEIGALVAAALTVDDQLTTIVYKAYEARPTRKLTEEQRAIWDEVSDKLDMRALEYPSATEVARSITKVLIDKVTELHKNEAVKQAYDEYLLLLRLAK